MDDWSVVFWMVAVVALVITFCLGYSFGRYCAKCDYLCDIIDSFREREEAAMYRVTNYPITKETPDAEPR